MLFLFFILGVFVPSHITDTFCNTEIKFDNTYITTIDSKKYLCFFWFRKIKLMWKCLKLDSI